MDAKVNITTAETYHVPVMLHETVDGMNIQPGGIYVDLTLGGAGHSKEILARMDGEARLFGFDQDEDAEQNIPADERFTFVRSNFRYLSNFMRYHGVDGEVDAILADLGVSSPQFDEGDRGFSYRMDARLDMRMDQNSDLDAYKVVNGYSVKDLTRVFRDYGEEKFAFQIAKNIEKARAIKPIETTFDLVEIIKKTLPAKVLEKKGHPAKQVFQAIRIEVNDELNVLENTLKRAINSLKIGGRCAVISFHSLEDKIVKDIFKSHSFIEGDRLNFDTVKEVKFKLVNKKVIIPSDEEIAANPRSKSAKLRVIERIK